MDLNSISVEAIWALMGTVSAGTALSVLTFIKTSVSGKKFTKVSDFAVVADQSMKFAKSEMLKAKDEIVERTKQEVVEPLKQQVKSLVSDNAQLASLCVSLVALTPMPIDVKKNAVEVIGKINNVSVEAKALLESSLEAQKQQLTIEQNQNKKLNDDIGNI